MWDTSFIIFKRHINFTCILLVCDCMAAEQLWWYGCYVVCMMLHIVYVVFFLCESNDGTVTCCEDVKVPPFWYFIVYFIWFCWVICVLANVIVMHFEYAACICFVLFFQDEKTKWSSILKPVRSCECVLIKAWRSFHHLLLLLFFSFFFYLDNKDIVTKKVQFLEFRAG